MGKKGFSTGAENAVELFIGSYRRPEAFRSHGLRKDLADQSETCGSTLRFHRLTRSFVSSCPLAPGDLLSERGTLERSYFISNAPS